MSADVHLQNKLLCTVTLNTEDVIHNSNVMFSSIPVIDVLLEV